MGWITISTVAAVAVVAAQLEKDKPHGISVPLLIVLCIIAGLMIMSGIISLIVKLYEHFKKKGGE